MTKRMYCKLSCVIGSYAISNNSSINIHGIQYGIDDYIYCSFSGSGKTTYHKLKIYNDILSDNPYFKFHGMKIMLSDCMRVN